MVAVGELSMDAALPVPAVALLSPLDEGDDDDSVVVDVEGFLPARIIPNIVLRLSSSWKYNGGSVSPP